jgi:hypothetical protein
MKRKAIKSLNLNKKAISNLQNIAGGENNLVKYTHFVSCEGGCNSLDCDTNLGTLCCNNTITVCGSYGCGSITTGN